MPARNEAVRLAGTVDALVPYVRSHEGIELVLVLDSSSDDNTVEVGRRAATTDAAIRVEIIGSKGKGNAVAAGVNAARGTTVLLADADLAVDPSQFDALIEPAESGALAIASRSMPGSRRIGEPVSRFVLGRLFNIAVQTLILPGMHDTQCGFKAFPRESLASVFGTLQTEGWCFDVELIARARQLGMRVVEVPVTWEYGHGSKLSVGRHAPQIVREVVELRRRFGRVPPAPTLGP